MALVYMHGVEESGYNGCNYIRLEASNDKLAF